MGHFVMPAELAEIISLHRQMFGGFTMEADEGAAPDAQDAPEAPQGPDPDDEQLGDAGKRALAAERKAAREARQQLADAQAKLQAIEDAGKTELQKSTERSQQLEADLGTAQMQLARAEVALEKGLTLKQASRLVGSTREELLADADELLAEFQSKAPAKPGLRIPDQLPDGAKPAPDDVAKAFFGL